MSAIHSHKHFSKSNKWFSSHRFGSEIELPKNSLKCF